MPDEPTTPSTNQELTAEIVAGYVRRNQIGTDQLASVDLDRSSGARQPWETGNGSPWRAKACCVGPAIRSRAIMSSAWIAAGRAVCFGGI